ncbi:YccF domain-containing protein [Corynebacterium caspium]|uniref:YccF domain-containing protein n=1 Tax=Corynebacterium caspium TaxID=234828 RepID=UPI00035FACE3|nr:YccF domain-containing protein [Corynebacterium caspium]WKD59680.1 Inner membrane protein YccF [Corynebacterium caspium DSM 44850]
MRFILNIIWLIFGGFVLFCLYIIFGLFSAIFIITLPASLACFRIAGYVLWPFGRVVVQKPDAGGATTAMNLVWFVVAGFWLAMAHLGSAFFLALTIIGIPLAIADLKMIPVTCFPFGKTVVSKKSFPNAEPSFAI